MSGASRLLWSFLALNEITVALFNYVYGAPILCICVYAPESVPILRHSAFIIIHNLVFDFISLYSSSVLEMCLRLKRFYLLSLFTPLPTV